MEDVEQLAEQEQPPTVRELYEHYKEILWSRLMEDEAYRNARLNSDRQNAMDEGHNAVERAAQDLGITQGDMQFYKLYYGNTPFHNRLNEELANEGYDAYMALSAELPPWGVEVGNHSPWGIVQTTQELAAGVFKVSTPGHGGIMLREALAKEYLSPELLARGGKENGWCFFEEDELAPLVEAELERNSILQEQSSDVPEQPQEATDTSASDRDPLSLPYKVYDTVYLDDTAFRITEIGLYDVQLQDPTLLYPVFRSENKETFEKLLRRDERNRYITDTFQQDMPAPQDSSTPASPQTWAEPVAIYPAEKNNLPFDVVIETLHIEEPQRGPAPQNFHITNDNLGAGGAKAKYQMNMAALKTLHDIELENRAATSEEQAVLSKYVGWGALSDAFDEGKPDWTAEYTELRETLTPEEYESARASTLKGAKMYINPNKGNIEGTATAFGQNETDVSYKLTGLGAASTPILIRSDSDAGLGVTPESEEVPTPTDESVEPSASEPTPASPPSIEPEETLSPTEPPTPDISPEPSGSPAPSVSPAPSASPTPEQDIIQVAVPNYGQVILNPYGLDVEIDGETTRSPVISRSCPITNLSSIPVAASVRAVGTTPAGSEATFAVTPDNLEPKQIFLYAEFRTESGSWASGYQDAGNQLVITEEPVERAEVLSLAPQETGFFRLFGDIQKASQWSSTDSVNVSLVFAFSATQAATETE